MGAHLALNKGAKLIAVDPRLTRIAARADVWLQLRPGTDAALALGMLHVIVSEKLYDGEFVKNHVYGWEPFVERVNEYPLERVEAITWVPKEKIRGENEAVIYRFANLLGTPNVLTAGHFCYGPRIATSIITCGTLLLLVTSQTASRNLYNTKSILEPERRFTDLLISNCNIVSLHLAEFIELRKN